MEPSRNNVGKKKMGCLKMLFIAFLSVIGLFIVMAICIPTSESAKKEEEAKIAEIEARKAVALLEKSKADAGIKEVQDFVKKIDEIKGELETVKAERDQLSEKLKEAEEMKTSGARSTSETSGEFKRDAEGHIILSEQDEKDAEEYAKKLGIHISKDDTGNRDKKEEPKDSSEFASLINGKVVGVIDGDTVTVLDSDKTQHKIRLYGIDAPERKQDFGQRSKQVLSSLVYESDVKVMYKEKDRYGRVIGKIYCKDLYVNAEMIRKGMAWHYKQYSKDQDLADLEEKARSERLGVWSKKNPTPPWEFRHPKKSAEKNVEVKSEQGTEQEEETYWVTSSSGKIHNSSCRYFKKSGGRETKTPKGSNCKICGGKM